MASRAAFWAAGITYTVLFIALLISIAASSTPLAYARLCLWSNGFFLWPVVRALTISVGLPANASYPAAWGEAGVFFMTFAASVIHHGCIGDMAIRTAIAAETYWLLWLGAAVFLVTVIVTSCRWVAGKHWQPASQVIIAIAWIIAFVASAIVLGIAVSNVGAGQLDGCVWPHASGDLAYEATVVPELVKVWDSVDFVTAFSALIIAVLFLLQVTDTLALAIFWTFAVLLVVTQLYRRMVPGSFGQDTIMAVVAVLGGICVVCQCVVCCTYPQRHVEALLKRYDKVDFVAAVLVGVAAIFLFLDDNTPAIHSLWHALGGLALFFTLEARYRKLSLFALPRAT